MEHSDHNENKKTADNSTNRNNGDNYPLPCETKIPFSFSTRERENLSLSSLTEHKEKGISVSHGNYPLTVSSVLGIIKKMQETNIINITSHEFRLAWGGPPCSFKAEEMNSDYHETTLVSEQNKSWSVANG